jgi:hypothetical protein
MVPDGATAVQYPPPLLCLCPALIWGGKGYFPGGECYRIVALITHQHLVPRLRMDGVYLRSSYVCMAPISNLVRVRRERWISV